MSKKFRTMLDRAEFRTSPGDPYLDNYRFVINEEGVEELTKCGKENIYEKIQAARFSADLKMILAKYENHEIQSLDFVSGVYGDFISVPKTVHELRQRMLDADAMFKTLPLEVREKFKHDPNIFFNSIGTEFYNETMAPYIQKANMSLEKNGSKGTLPEKVPPIMETPMKSEVSAE